MYQMTFTESSVVDDVLNAFAGHRWHTTTEIAHHAHYSKRQTLRTLRKLVADGIIEHTEYRIGQVLLWRVVETRHCTYCHTTEPLGHFYKNYRSGGWYSRCQQARHDTYRRNNRKKEDP